MSTINLEIPSIPENIRMVESFIDNVKDKFKIDDDIYGNIMIAVTEAINNAIIHGNGNDKSKNVHLSMNIEDARVSFTIQDEGAGFDVTNLPDPLAPENIDKPSGRGIFLMQSLCDEVNFKDDGKLTELIFYMN